MLKGLRMLLDTQPFRVGLLLSACPRVGRKRRGRPWALLRDPSGSPKTFSAPFASVLPGSTPPALLHDRYRDLAHAGIPDIHRQRTHRVIEGQPDGPCGSGRQERKELGEEARQLDPGPQLDRDAE